MNEDKKLSVNIKQKVLGHLDDLEDRVRIVKASVFDYAANTYDIHPKANDPAKETTEPIGYINIVDDKLRIIYNLVEEINAIVSQLPITH